jgi:hypothetical protein
MFAARLLLCSYYLCIFTYWPLTSVGCSKKLHATLLLKSEWKGFFFVSVEWLTGKRKLLAVYKPVTYSVHRVEIVMIARKRQ